jgi:hypothetical protein
MKNQPIIQHTIKRIDKTISGKIIKINWGVYEDCSGNKIKLSRYNYRKNEICAIWLENNFVITGAEPTELYDWGEKHGLSLHDSREVFCNFETEERAIEVMKLIDSITEE